MNRSQLAYELQRYIKAMRKEEPPRRTGSSNVEAEEDVNGTSREEGGTTGSDRNDPDRHSAQERLSKLEDEATGCTKCRLSENRTQVVFGEGTAAARIMVVGEGPGADEDREGYPFVGRAGELLRGGFEKVGLPKDSIYITNTVKCRPPDNRNPRQDELDACRPYLDQQLEIIDPEVVITLGNFALRYCLGDDRRITRSRGEVYDWNDRALVPTYHPAYVLRNQNEAQTFIDDLKLARDRLND